MKKPWQRYLIDTGPPTIAYVASVVASALICKQMEPGVLRVLMAMLPVPAIAWMAHAEIMRLRRRDELRQRIELEAMTAAFAVSFGLVVMLTFLNLHGAIVVPIEVAAVLMAVCWVGAQFWVRARYRYWWHQPDNEES